MKTLLSTAGALMLLPICLDAETVLLHDALQKKLVEVKITGAAVDSTVSVPVSSHYGPCLLLEVRNLSGAELTVQLDFGYRLMPADSAVQTMMMTKTYSARLAPGQKKKSRVYAMCADAPKSSPSPKISFSPGRRATGSILELANLLHRKNYQDATAQSALWCLTNNYEISSIISNDTAMMYDLRRFVAKAKGVAEKEIYAGTHRFVPDQMSSTPVYRQAIHSGTISYSIAGMRTVKVLIALFDENDRMKTVYVNNEAQREGQYTYAYRVSSSELNDKKHYVRMFRDGRLEEEIAIIPPRGN